MTKRKKEITLKVLALDLATEFGVYDGILPPFTVKLEDKMFRVLQFFVWLTEYTTEHEYDVIVVENALNQKAYANEAFHELKALVRLVCQQNNIRFEEMSPAHIKKVFTGTGRAEKKDIISECIKRGIELPFKILKSGPSKGDKRYNDNAADAVAIYFTYLEDKKEADSDF